MSKYYNPKRTRNIFDPDSKEPFKLSRTRLDLFINCARCFYIDRRLGTDRPPGYPLSLNNAVDVLLKKEFDIHRVKKSCHPFMEQYGVDAVPFQHEKIGEWRNSRAGIQYLHEPTNLLLTGAIDDVWINPSEELLIVDYKATSKDGEITIDDDWQMGYKRQMEFYQWLFRKNGFKVSDTGYFVYCNGKTDKQAFDKKIEFDVKVIPYTGNGDWIEKAVLEAHKCLMGDTIPESNPDCEYCQYRKEVSKSLTSERTKDKIGNNN